MLGNIAFILKVLCIVQQIQQSQGLVIGEKNVGEAEVVYPERIHATRKKDDLNTEDETGQHEDTLNIRIPTKQEGDLDLELKKREVVPSRLLLRTYDEEGAPMHKWHDQPNCFYTGEVKNKRESNVHVSTCDATVNGYVEFDSKRYELQSHDDQKGSHKLIPVEDAIGQGKDYVEMNEPVQMDEKEIKKSPSMEKDLNVVKIFDKESIQETKKWNSMFVTETEEKPVIATNPNSHAVPLKSDDQNDEVPDKWKPLFTQEIVKDTLGETDPDTDKMTSQFSDEQDSKKKEDQGNSNLSSSVLPEDVVEEDEILLDDMQVAADQQNNAAYKVRTTGKCKSVSRTSCLALRGKVRNSIWRVRRYSSRPAGCYVSYNRYFYYNTYPSSRSNAKCSARYKCVCENTPHPCDINNGGCEGTCVKKDDVNLGDVAVCTCGEGLMLAPDGKACVPLPAALVSNDDCCKVIDFTLQGPARSKQTSTIGRYVRFEIPLNGRYYYVKTDGRYAMWYMTQINGWVVGDIGMLGQANGIRLVELGRESAYCPHEKRLASWKYFTGSAWASADVRMSCSDVNMSPDLEPGRSIVVIKSATWLQAKQHCSDMGLALAVINSQAENNEMLRLRNAKALYSGVWIGYSDRQTEGQWRWVDGSQGTYTNWNSGEPNNAGNEDCAQMNRNGKWNDATCDTRSYAFICKNTGDETVDTSPNREFCQDKQLHTACSLHANGGLCESHRITLDKYCRKTCGLCTAASPYCEDKPFPAQAAENCASVVQKGLCTSDRPLAERYCKKSCGLCTGNEPSKPATTSAADYLYSEGVASQSNGYCAAPVTKEMCATMYPSTGPMVVMDPTHQTWAARGIAPPGCFLYEDLNRRPLVRKMYWNTYSESKATCKNNFQCICIKFSVSAITASSVDGQHIPKNALASTTTGFFMSQAENRPWLKAELVDRNPLELSTINSIDIIMRDDSNGQQFKNVEVRAGSSPEISDNEVVGIFRGPGQTGGVSRVQLMKSLAFSSSEQNTKFNINNPRFLIFQMQGNGVLAVKGFMENFNQAPRSRVRCQGQSAGKCCTSANPCDVSQGQCDDDSQCKEGLKCGQNNCHWGQGRCCQPQQETGKQYLSRGGVLLKGTELTSPNGQYHLQMGYDGHLVLRKDGQAADVWKSTKDDDGRPGDDGLFFTTSGYLYIPYHYDSFRFEGSEPLHIWDSRIQLELRDHVATLMELQDDGNLVISKKVGYQMQEIWSSKNGVPTSHSLKLVNTVPDDFAQGLYHPAPADIDSKYLPHMSAKQKSQTRYLELFVSVGYNLLKLRFGHDANRAVREVLNHMFRVDQVFAKINTRIVVSAMEVHNNGPSFQRHFDDSSKDLDEFKKHVSKLKREDAAFHDIPIDDALLFTNQGWPGGVLGLAYVNGMCQSSGAAISRFGNVALTAHELGHNFGLNHVEDNHRWFRYLDDVTSCDCLGSYRSCLMEAVVGGYEFTDCDIKGMEYIHDMGGRWGSQCLDNVPKNLAPKCGNGILEPGEECDCGTAAQCARKDPCCVATTCRKKTTAQCAQ